MKAVWSWIKRHGLVHLVIVAIFSAPMVWLLHIVPSNDSLYASKVRIWFDSLEYRSVDDRMQFGRAAQADPNIVLFSIDSPSTRGLDALDDATIQASPALASMKATNYPFSRDVYALACDRLIAAGAKVVAFDLIFLAPSPTDPAFKEALEKYHDHLVIGLRFNDDSTTIDLPPQSLIPSGDPMDGRLGYFNYWHDSDDLIRGARYRTNLVYLAGKPGANREPKLYSLAARIVQRAGHPELVPDDFLSRPLRFTVRSSTAGATPFRTYSFYQLFDPASWEKTFANGDYFKNKIVVIGPDGGLFHDVHPTPAGDLPGVELHLNAVNALLHDEFLRPASNGVAICVTLIFAVFALALASFIPSIALRFGVALALLAAYASVTMWAYNGSGWLLPVVAPVGVFSASVGVGFVYDFVVAQLEKYRLRIMFEGYSSKNVVKYLLSHPDSYNQMLAGTRRDISVLFSDIRGFTTIVETASDSRELVRTLNEYLTAMVDCVIRQDGNLEKFMGDGIMAVWGNTPYTNGAKDDAVRAVRAAVAMTVSLERLNAKWRSEGRAEWRIGVGVNHGNVIVGDMGSTEHKEFAMVGDAVNLGSRLEGLTKTYHVQVMVGELAANLVDDTFYLRSVGVVVVKGKSQPVKTFTVLGEKKAGLPPQKLKFLELHEAGMAAFRGREFDRARKFFEQVLQLEPEDYLAAMYLENAREFAATPPGPDWTGVTVMKEK